jgi:hypothetical protein
VQNPAKEEPRKMFGFPWILFAVLSLFKGLRRPPTDKILLLRRLSPFPSDAARRLGAGKGGREEAKRWSHGRLILGTPTGYHIF